jgi:rhamnosyltransferase
MQETCRAVQDVLDIASDNTSESAAVTQEGYQWQYVDFRFTTPPLMIIAAGTESRSTFSISRSIWELLAALRPNRIRIARRSAFSKDEFVLCPPCRENIQAVIVTHDPDLDFSKRVAVVARQVRAVVIVDNASAVLTVGELCKLRNEPSVQLILNVENRGIAAALNQGIDVAVSHGAKWALLVDQDTLPAEDLLLALVRVYANLPQPDHLAVLGANFASPASVRPKAQENAVAATGWRECKTVITSGSLISLGAYSRIGPFREDFFIDHVDDEYCLRARSKGFTIIATLRTFMVQRVGNPSRHRFLWKSIVTTNHSADRRYYMMRNQVLIFRDYFLREPIWVLGNMWSRFKSLVAMCFFESERTQKLKLTAQGLLDGLLGKAGRLSRQKFD